MTARTRRPLHEVARALVGSRDRTGARATELGLLAGLVGILLACLSMALVHVVYQGIDIRAVARAPHLAERASSPVGLYLDTAHAGPPAVLLVQPLQSPATAPPPGLVSWPARGEAAVSPEVARQYPLGGASPWGKVTQVVTQTGLVNPNEQLVYANPRDYTIAREANEVDRWGDSQMTSGDALTMHPESQLHQIIALFLLLPAVSLMAAAAGRAAEGLRHGLLLLHGLGAQRRLVAEVAWVLLRRAVAVVAAATAVVVGICATRSATPIPFMNTYVQGVDVRSGWLWIVLACGAAGVLAWLVVYRACRPRTRLSSASVAEAPRAHRGIVSLGLILSVALWLTKDHLGAIAPLWLVQAMAGASLLLFVLCAPFLVPLLCILTSRLLVARARGGATVVSGRVLGSQARRAEMVAASIVTGILLVFVAKLFGGYFAQVVTDARQANDQFGQRVLLLRTPASGWSAERFGTLPASFAEIDVLPVADGAEGAVIHGSCPMLRSFGLACPTRGTHVGVASSSPALASFVAPAAEVEDDYRRRTAHLYLARARDGSPLSVERLAADGFQSQVRVLEVGDDWVQPDVVNQRQLRWLFFFGVPGVVLLVGALMVWVGHDLRQVLRRLAAMRALDGRSRIGWIVSGWTVLLPFVASVAVACAATAVLGLGLSRAYDGMPFHGGDVLLLALTGIVTSVVAWVAVTRENVALAVPTSSNFDQEKV